MGDIPITMKLCAKGKHLQNRDQFTSSRDATDGLSPWCHSCTNAYYRERYRVRMVDPVYRHHRVKLSKAWARRNPEAARAYQRKHQSDLYANDPLYAEKVRERRRQFYATHKEAMLTQKRAFYAANRDHLRHVASQRRIKSLLNEV
jgi:hypothetical protein